MLGIVLEDVKVLVTVVPFTKLFTIPVPPVLVIFPLLAMFVALTWRPLMVIVSDLFVAEQVYVMVIVETVTAIGFTERLALPATVTVPVPD